MLEQPLDALGSAFLHDIVERFDPFTPLEGFDVGVVLMIISTHELCFPFSLGGLPRDSGHRKSLAGLEPVKCSDRP